MQKIAGIVTGWVLINLPHLKNVPNRSGCLHSGTHSHSCTCMHTHIHPHMHTCVYACTHVISAHAQLKQDRFYLNLTMTKTQIWAKLPLSSNGQIDILQENNTERVPLEKGISFVLLLIFLYFAVFLQVTNCVGLNSWYSFIIEKHTHNEGLIIM